MATNNEYLILAEQKIKIGDKELNINIKYVFFFLSLSLIQVTRWIGYMIKIAPSF